jgi:YVTN family beta-propeller protein
MTFPRRREIPLRLVVLATLASVLFLAPTAAGLHALSATTPPPTLPAPDTPSPTSAPGPHPAESADPRPAGAGLSVESTTVLFNDTNISGNFAAQYGVDPYAVAFDPVSDDLFVSVQYPWQLDVVHVVPFLGAQVVATVPIAGEPMGLAYDPVDGTIYVADAIDNQLDAVNATNLTVVDTIPVGTEPVGVVYDTHTENVYVENSGSDNVSVINGTTNASIGSGISVGGSGASDPRAIAFDSSTNQIFVADYAWTSHTSMPVVVIDDANNSVVSTVFVGDEPDALEYDPTDSDMFVANYLSSNLTAISDATDTTVGNYSGFDYPAGIAYLPAEHTLDVSNDNGSVTDFYPTTQSILCTTGVGADPMGVTYTDFNGGATVVVANWLSGNISFLDVASCYESATTRLTQSPHGIAYDGAQNELFLSNGELYDSGGSVSVLNDSRNVLTPTLPTPVGTNPAGIAFDPVNDEVFVANTGNNSVSVLSSLTNDVVATIGVGDDPFGVTYDPTDQEVWVVNSGSDNVSVIDPATNAVVGSVSITADASALGIAYDSATGFLYVTESGYDQIGLINAALQTFNGTVGSGAYAASVVYDSVDHLVYVANEGDNNVTVYAQTNDTNTRVVANITIPNEPYGLAYDAATDEVFVSEFDSDVVEAIQPSTESVIGNVTVGITPAMMAVDTAHSTLYVNDYQEGATTVVAIAPVNSTPMQEFDASGLPSGATWYVNVTGQPSNSATVNGVAGHTLDVPLPPGNYTYAAATSWSNWTTSSGGRFTVNSSDNEPIEVRFDPVLFLVTVNESGLSYGATWYFNVSGQPSAFATVMTDEMNSTTLELQNGTYSWTVATNWANYSANEPNGEFVVHGATKYVSVGFTASVTTLYAVTFDESSLPIGATWYVNVSGEMSQSATVSSGSGTTIQIELANATYRFSASANVASWVWNDTVSGTSFSVAGAPRTVSVPFQFQRPTETFAVQFTEIGLPSGDTYTVVLGGRTLSGAAPAALSANFANGTYPFTVSSVGSYAPNATSGSVTVNGHAVTVALTYAAPSSGATTNSSSWLWIGGGILVALIVLVLILFAWKRRKKPDPQPAAGTPGASAPPDGSAAGPGTGET